MLTQEVWLCPQVLSLKFEGLISFENLSISLLHLQECVGGEDKMLLLDLSELMYTNTFVESLDQHKPLTHLLTDMGLRHVVMVIPGELESPLAQLIYMHHQQMGLADHMTITGDREQAQQKLCQLAPTCCFKVRVRSPHG